MSAVAEWLPAFLQTRGLDQADGRPLYAYRCKGDEFAELTQALREELGPSLRSQGSSFSQRQAFCLWAAEWWRRNHEGGPWSWEGPLLDIGCGDLRPNHRGYGDLQDMVARGIRSWKRELLRTGLGRAFLVTIACEGGLPLKLVLREQAGLRRYFQALLEEFRASASHGVAPEQMAERVRSWLPRSLRQEVVYQLSGELIARIWELQAEVGETRTPVSVLDQRRPNWREDLPLHLDDAVARSLLNNLVSEASVLARQHGRRIRWRRRLESVDHNWHLVGELGLPGSMDAEGLRALFGFADEEALPPRFELARVQEGRVPEIAALGTRRFEEGGHEYFAVEPTSRDSRRLFGVEAASGNALLLRDGRRSWTTVEFGGADSLSEDLPWVFEPRGEGVETEIRLLGEGSVSLRGPEALVAVPVGAKIQLLSGAELKGVGPLNDLQREVYRLSGEAEVVDEWGASIVRTGVEGAAGPAEYRLSGARHEFGRGTSAVFVGCPQVVEDRASGMHNTIPRDQVWWRPAGVGGEWRRIDDSCVGDVRIRHAVSGELRFSSSAKVVPQDSKVVLRPSIGVGAAGQGSVEVLGFGADAVRVEAIDGVSTEIESLGAEGDHRVTLRALGEPPRTTTLGLTWAGERRLALEVPFPSQGVSFHSPDGSRLENHERVSVRNLSGIHGRALVPGSGCWFFIDGVYRGTGVAVDLHHDLTIREAVPEVGDGHFEYDLGNLQSRVELLLSMTDDVDGCLEVELQSNEVRGLVRRTLRLGHYDLEFERGEDEVRLTVSSFSRIDAASIEALRVEAFRPSAPHLPAIELSRVRNGVWTVPEHIMEPGPWLVVGWDGGWCRMRPCLWIVGRTPGNELHAADAEAVEPVSASSREAKPLSAEWASAHPTRSERIAAFRPLLVEMGEQPAHLDWDVVDGTIRWARDLPAMTFDLIDALIHEPKAATMAALRCPDDDDFAVLWDRLETLPFSWRALPIDAWEQAVGRYVEPLIAELAEVAKAVTTLDVNEEIGKELDRVSARIVSRLPSLQPVFACVRADLFGLPLGPEESALRSGMLNEMLLEDLGRYEEDLLRARAAHDQWPGGPALESKAAACKQNPAYKSLWRKALLGARFRQDVLNAPIVAAVLAVENETPERNLMLDLRRAAEFDKQWFEDAHRSAFLYVYGRELAERMGNRGG